MSEAPSFSRSNALRAAGKPVHQRAGVLNGSPLPVRGLYVIGEAILNYRQGSDINGHSPQNFRDAVRNTNGLDAVGLGRVHTQGGGYDLPHSNLYRKALVRELTIIDVANSTGLTISEVRKQFDSDTQSAYDDFFANVYKKMTPEQQQDYRNTLTTEEHIRHANSIQRIGHRHTEGELEKQKKAEAIDIRNTIEAGNITPKVTLVNGSVVGGNEKKWRERKFYHEDLDGTNGYKDKIGLYKHLDHNDKKRREKYYKRHKERNIKDKSRAKYWSHKILW